jgi:hypothetical protein
MAPEKCGPTLNTKLAKAETLLLLALLMEGFVGPWIYAQTQIPPFAKTLIKMLLVVGCFGPVFKIFSRAIDHTLLSARSVTTSKFPLPRIAFHLFVMSAIFLAFYWNMHRSTPWTNFRPAADQRAEVRKRNTGL